MGITVSLCVPTTRLKGILGKSVFSGLNYIIILYTVMITVIVKQRKGFKEGSSMIFS